MISSQAVVSQQHQTLSRATKIQRHGQNQCKKRWGTKPSSSSSSSLAVSISTKAGSSNNNDCLINTMYNKFNAYQNYYYYYQYNNYNYNNDYWNQYHRYHVMSAIAVAATTVLASAVTTSLSSNDEREESYRTTKSNNNDYSSVNSSNENGTDTSSSLSSFNLQQYISQIPSSTDQTVTSMMNEIRRLVNTTSTTTSGISSRMALCDAMSTTTTTASSYIPESRLRRHSTIQKMNQAAVRDTIESKYNVQWDKPLGEGSFGQVYLATDRITEEQLAVKKISKKYTDNSSFQREMDALLHLRNNGGHPHICGLREHYEEGSYYYLLLDLIQGGEMFDHLCTNGAYSEADAARLIREVANALAFLHGIGIVHGDMKPENLMLSSENSDEAVIKLVDFGCAQTLYENDIGEWVELHSDNDDRGSANTPAYCPPEILERKRKRTRTLSSTAMNLGGYFNPFRTDTDDDSDASNRIDPSFDMWALGVILYIMLTGVHPFDLYGNASDSEIERKILSKHKPPLRHSPLTAHLSKDALSVIESLIQWDAKKRLTAHELLQHPWVRGETALTKKMADSDKRLSAYRAFKTRIEAKVFADMASLTSATNDDDEPVLAHRDEDLTANKSMYRTQRTSMNYNKDDLYQQQQQQQQSISDETKFTKRSKSTRGGNDVAKRTSLIELAFHKMDPQHRGYVTTSDLDPKEDGTSTNGENDSEANKMNLSTFSDLLSENMKNRYFPKGHIVYNQGDIGNVMYFINSGTVEVFTNDGLTKTIRYPGDFFGEGALLHPEKIRSASIRCTTPVHAIEISREYFEKYMASDSDVALNLREKDKSRKRQRAKAILLMQNNMQTRTFKKGETLFKAGEEGDFLYILEEGQVHVSFKNKFVFTVKPGEMCGEHSLLFGKPRNTTARCVATEGCTAGILRASDFFKLLDHNPCMKESLKDIGYRREFQKALCLVTKKSFPQTEEELRKAFDIVDRNKSGYLELSNIQYMILQLDSSYTEEFVKAVLRALNLDESGRVSWPEFKRIFNLENQRPN